jgi:Rubredoxin
MRVMDLDHPTKTVWPDEDDFVYDEGTGKYVCSICGYVYDPAEGDPDHGIPAGTKFEDLPADWHCPRCRQGKEKFGKA